MRLLGDITPTRVELGSRCYRRHAISDILEKGLYKSPSAAFGSVVHAGAGAHWSKLNVVEAATAEYQKNINDLNDKHSLGLALGMLETYVEKARAAGSFDDEYQLMVDGVELRLPYEVNGFKITAQMDRVLSNRESMLIVDLKTASRIDKRWRSSWELSLQMKLYKLIAQKVYDRPVDVIIEGLLKDVPSKIEYVVLPDWTEDQLQEAQDQFIRIATKDKMLLARASVDGVIDINRLFELALNETEFNYQDCNSYGVECPFRRLCVAPPSERVGLLLAEYRDIIGEY